MKKQRHYLLVGYPFSGKTTFAKELEKQLGFARISIDDVKHELVYKDIPDENVPDDGWEKIFAETDKRIKKYLEEGKTLINEYAWVTKAWRDKARSIADSQGVETKVIFVDTPEGVVRERWMKNKKTNERFDLSSNDFEEALEIFERPTSDENTILYSNNQNVEEWITINIVI